VLFRSEADTDRTVYQAAWETLQNDKRIDIHFSTVGGAGGIAHTCNLYRALKIPVAVIADLDTLVNQQVLRQVLETLAERVDVEPLLERAQKIELVIKRIQPTLSPDCVQTRLRAVGSGGMDWSRGDDAFVATQLRSIANDLDRIKRLKAGGVASLPPELRGEVENIITELSRYGLFLVPVGELEQWFDGTKVSVSKQDKPAWANAAANYIQNGGPHEDGVWGFLTGVARYLTQ